MYLQMQAQAATVLYQKLKPELKSFNTVYLINDTAKIIIDNGI